MRTSASVCLKRHSCWRVKELSGQIRPLLSFRAMSSAPGQPHASHNYETLKVSQAQEKVLHVELNRPEKRNAMNAVFWREMVECFNKIAQDSECHAVVVSGTGKLFTAGIDLMEMGSVFMVMEGDDMARKAWNIRKKLREHQETFSVLEKCPKPVIAAVHGACIGAGVDLISACDIRYCTQDAWFQVKEVEIGLAADMGTLQRLPRIMGNRSRVFQDKQAMLEGAFELAADIASKSPVAVQGTKVNLLYSRDHSVPESLRYMATWNMSMLQTEDLVKSAQAALEKKSTKDIVYAKL
ncbi:delta(3,5)-Delta(2,4)-dienoyl-CoA isomerase, mitochondrial-like isoform X4 [Carettochelys insculpta]|uniref:delta(3,5)-Delta(2,4)-dienoyl-CoA isomerase, mitochondrial-like isoform X4 n=1 Tax=Carettochelys insculpta TaxID=44489 RepID=UPI003EBA9D5D